MRLNYLARTLVVAAAVVVGLTFAACGADDDDVCLHDFGPGYECFPDWDKELCDEKNWDWVEGQTCSELGYNVLCGGQSYTKPGTCPF